MRNILYFAINIVLIVVGILALIGKINYSPLMSILVLITSILVNCTSLILNDMVSKETKKRRAMFWISFILWFFILMFIKLTPLEDYLNADKFGRLFVLLMPWMCVPFLGILIMNGLLEAKEVD